ncbi:hypothetical protein KVR01_005394 [Diaporthe batatas]|uniref:uncharacterized protein n=1 Tax=Diaporthe batatas TaxID=748121 RepID=UPI001D0493A6|nr:uncharacterized protein KVR01_005394 [Diaporthe batatas]KAG8165119.1 hypothetical protein KVR01_005394 [Diaporthe batatas]
MMWSSSYPTSTPSQVDGKTYDYIIVGGGTAGCVLAARLSEDTDVSVLVLEKGHVKDNLVSRMPLLSQNMFLGDPLQVQSTRWSEPIPEANGRRTRIWTSEGIGGATRINAMLMTRGCRADYVAWSNELGLSDWGWEQVEPYFRKIENAVDHPESKARGHDGPVEGRAAKMPFKWVPYIEKSFQKLGLPLGGDCNGPDAPAMGLFNLEAAIDKHGRRISALQAFLGKKLAKERSGRLTICTGVVVSRLDIDGPAGLVNGVHIQSSQGNQTDKFSVKARREVILCSGAICTPQILLLSGIGPTTLASETNDSLDIPLIKELPAVGTMFSDHYSFPIMLELPKKETFHVLESIWGLWHMLLWLFVGKGLFARTAMASAAYLRTGAINPETMSVKTRQEDGTDNLDSSHPANRPDVEIMVMPINGLERHVPGHALFNLHPTIIQPYATGSITLKSKNALDNPRIVYPMFTDERDLAAARLAVRFTMRVAAEFQASGYPYPAPFAFAPGNRPDLLREWEETGDEWSAPKPTGTTTKTTSPPTSENSNDGKTWKTVTDGEIDDYVKRVSHTSLHPVCTCPMSNDESSGVVNQKLRVHGFKNLRIADASVFPRVPTSHTMIPVMMIAERCADFIKQDWKAST